MKILFSSLGYPTKNHPFAAFIAMVAEEFARRGHEVTVIAPQSVTRNIIRGFDALPYMEHIMVEGAPYKVSILRPKSFTFGDGRLRGKLTILSNKISVERCLSRLCTKFDVIYAHFWEAAYNVLSYAEKNRLPLVIVTGEDRIAIHKYMTSSTKIRLKRSTFKVIGVSSKNIRESIGCGLALPCSSIVVPNGPDLRFFYPHDRIKVRQELGVPEDCFLVAFTGRFIHRKGAIRVENAILKLEDKSIKAVFIGSPIRDEDASQEPCGDEIFFKGIVDHKDLPKWLSASDIFVLPTLAEGCSNAIVEAMGCGLPIISSNMEFNYDVLDNSNSMLLDPLDTDEIAKRIKLLKDNPQLRIKMGNASLRKAEEISFEKRIERILNILKQAVDENNRI